MRSCDQLGLCQARPAPCMGCNHTTRRFPRNLQQAFPESEGYRNSVEGPYRFNHWERMCHWLGSVMNGATS